MVVIIDGVRHEVQPIQRVELSIISDKMCNLLKEYDLESIHVDVIAGKEGEEPFRHVKVVDKSGRLDSWTVLWEGDED